MKGKVPIPENSRWLSCQELNERIPTKVASEHNSQLWSNSFINKEKKLSLLAAVAQEFAVDAGLLQTDSSVLSEFFNHSGEVCSFLFTLSQTLPLLLIS